MPQMSASRSLIERPAPIARPLDVHALSVPARRFTGDFYFSHRVDDALWLAVGDVAGKGVNAAVVMAMIQEELEQRIASCARTACDPAVTMQRLHELLRPLLSRNRFATAVISRIHDDGTLRVANAGHPPPLIARHDGRIDSITSTGPAAGILDHSQWTSVTRHLAPGDTYLLYTDGAIEGNDFGVEGVSAALQKAAKTSARSVATSVAAAIRAHGGVEDDLTIVALKRVLGAGC